MSRDVDSVRLAIQELVEFGDKLIQLPKDEKRAILVVCISDKFTILLPSYLGPRWAGTELLISWLTEEQNARVNGEHRANRGILEVFESLDYRVANAIFESEVFVTLVWLRANLEGKD